MKNKFYTYIHINPDIYEIFYVGKGTGTRAYVKSKRNAAWKKYVETLKTEYKVLILKDNQTSEEAEELEQMIITKIGSVIEGGTLLNKAGLGFSPDILLPISIQEGRPNEESKYFGFTDEEIIKDILNFPNIQSGKLAEQRFEEIKHAIIEVLEAIEKYSEDILFDLECLYDDLEDLIRDHKHSSINREEYIDELEYIQENITEFREENEITELIEKALLPIEKEIKKLKNLAIDNKA